MANPERRVPLVDFKKEYREIAAEVNSGIKRVLESGWFILGPEVESFEKEFAGFVGVEYAVGVGTGTDAITLSLKALGIKEGDGVVVPANVYPSAFGVALSGAILQLADVDPKTLNLSLETLKRAVKQNTRAVLAVHLYGNPVDLEGIVNFCKDKHLALVEDCAQAPGAIYQGRRVGSFGDIACFSFYPTKNLGAYGDGGMVATNNRDLAHKIKLWRMYGEEARYQSKLIGHNSRLDEMQAAILRAKLKYVDGWNQRRREIAQRYKQEFSGLPLEIVSSGEHSQPVYDRRSAVYHLFVVITEDRDGLSDYLKRQGIASGIHYPQPIHLTESFFNLGHKVGDFPVSERASNTVLSLPLYPQMTDENIEYIIRQVKQFYLD